MASLPHVIVFSDVDGVLLHPSAVCTSQGAFDAVGSVVHPGSAVAALRALHARQHDRVITIGMADGFASPVHLAAMDAKSDRLRRARRLRSDRRGRLG